MSFLLLSILSSSILVMVFKFFPRYKVDTFQAIVINYIICVITGSIMLGRFPLDNSSFSEPWFPYAAGLGLLFVTGFYAVGMTVALFGLTVASVLQKMSLVISVPFAIWAFQEPATAPKIIGLIIALIAVVLTNWPQRLAGSSDLKIARDAFVQSGAPYFLIWLIPVYAYLVSGVIEIGLQVVQKSFLENNDEGTAKFSTAIFAMAGLIGIAAIAGLIGRGKSKLSLKNLIAGICLGVPNYFSIYFLIKAFGWWDKSIVLPVNNIAIVALTAFVGLIFFREPLSKLNLIGVILAILSIALISSEGILKSLGY